MSHKQSRLFLLSAFIILTFLCNLQQVFAQAGNFIQVWGGPQYVGIENFSDYSAENLSGQQNIVQTYRVGAGFDYVHNFNNMYGLQTGLYYSGVGQKYNGAVTNFYDSKDTSRTYPYTSQVTMDYIRIPFLLRFNSEIGETDKINISIFMGFQLGYLLDVKESSSSSIQIPPGLLDTFNMQNPHFNLRDLYKSLDFGLSAGAQINFKIKDWEYMHVGVRFDRSITNIENENYVLPDNAPVEYLYPVSTKKEIRMSHDDVIAGYTSQYIALNLYVGMSFRVKTIIPPPHIIRDDDEDNGNSPQ